MNVECNLKDEEVVASVYDELVKVDWTNLGEGHCGDYNPEDPEDEELLRFDVYVNMAEKREEPDWQEVEDASYCTNVPLSTDMKVLVKLLKIIHREYRDVITDNEYIPSVKKLGERLSWLNADDVAE